MQRVISPFKVTVQRRACWPDVPVSTSATLNFITKKKQSGLLNHTRPRTPQSITKLLRTSGASSDHTTTSTTQFHDILKSLLWSSTDWGLDNKTPKNYPPHFTAWLPAGKALPTTIGFNQQTSGIGMHPIVSSLFFHKPFAMLQNNYHILINLLNARNSFNARCVHLWFTICQYNKICYHLFFLFTVGICRQLLGNVKTLHLSKAHLNHTRWWCSNRCKPNQLYSLPYDKALKYSCNI